jgi:hypothetical protein
MRKLRGQHTAIRHEKLKKERRRKGGEGARKKKKRKKKKKKKKKEKKNLTVGFLFSGSIKERGCLPFTISCNEELQCTVSPTNQNAYEVQ